MSCVNHDMEKLRLQSEQHAHKQKSAGVEELRELVELTKERGIIWGDLPVEARERVCRIIDTAVGQKGFQALAYRLEADHVNASFYTDRAAGQLRGPTELMLEDVQQKRGALSAAVMLQFLLDGCYLNCLDVVRCGVQEACAHRQQALLLGASHRSSIDSGYNPSVSSTGELVCTVAAPPDDTMVQAVPLLSLPPSPSPSPPPPPPPPPPPHPHPQAKLKRLLLTYAADGSDQVRAITNQLTMRFSMLCLEDQLHHRLADPYTAVQKWFGQVQYVIVLMTPQYLAATQNKSLPADQRGRRLAEDARFVYTLMCAELENNRHVNWRVRTLVPDEFSEEVRRHALYGSPLFRWPYLVSELEYLAKCLKD